MPNTNCLLCNLPLGELELSLNNKWHKAPKDCQVCHYCKEPVTFDMAEKAIKDCDAQIGTCISEYLYHQPCHEKALGERFKNKDLPIVQEQLDLLNKFLLSQRSEIPLTLEELYPLLRDLQQCAANVSIALNRKKDKLKIKDAAAYREHVEIRKENNKLETRAIEEKKTRLASERADPALRNKRKALEGLIAMGLSKEQAEAMLAKPSVGGVQ